MTRFLLKLFSWPVRFAAFLVLLIPVSAVTSAVGENRQVFPVSISWEFLLWVYLIGTGVYLAGALAWHASVHLDSKAFRRDAPQAAWREFMTRERAGTDKSGDP